MWGNSRQRKKQIYELNYTDTTTTRKEEIYANKNSDITTTTKKAS